MEYLQRFLGKPYKVTYEEQPKTNEGEPFYKLELARIDRRQLFETIRVIGYVRDTDINPNILILESLREKPGLSTDDLLLEIQSRGFDRLMDTGSPRGGLNQLLQKLTSSRLIEGTFSKPKFYTLTEYGQVALEEFESMAISFAQIEIEHHRVMSEAAKEALKN